MSRVVIWSTVAFKMFSFRCYPQLFGVLRQIQNFRSSFCGIGQKLQYQIAAPLSHGGAFRAAYQKNGRQAIRCYTLQAAAHETLCWNCKKTTKPRSHMLCTECGHLQDVTAEMNYFELLDCPQSFDVEPQRLTRQFRQLQTIVHPDKFSNKSEREQSNSADWSSLINKAYKTLATPIERGQYLLKLHGLQIPEDNSTLDKEFLMEMMERNEEVDDATTEDEIRQLDERIVKEMNEKAAELIIQFNKNNLKEATRMLVQMKYLQSIQRSIKSKLQSSIF